MSCLATTGIGDDELKCFENGLLVLNRTELFMVGGFNSCVMGSLAVVEQ